MRRASKRKNRNSRDGSLPNKRIRPTREPVNSLFTRLLDNAGLTLSTGSEPNNIRLETPEFHKKLLKSLSSQDSPTDEIIEEFIKGFNEYISDLTRFHRCLTSTSLDKTVNSRSSSGGIISVIRMLLEIDVIQNKVSCTLIEKLLDFSDDPTTLSLAELRDFHQIPKLILNQLRWLHYLVDGKEFASKLMEIAGVVSLDMQRDIIQALPEIINDEEHNFIAMELKKLLESNSELTAACIDTWSNLNCNVELSAQILDIALERVSSANVEDLPVVIDYILTQKLSPKNAVDVISEIRDKLDTESCFVPIPTASSTPHQLQSLKSNSGGYVVLECIKSSLERIKLVADGWMKAIELVDEEEDHKLIDVYVIFALHGFPAKSKAVRTLVSNKIKSKKFTENIIANFFGYKIPAMKNLFRSILSLCEHLLCSTSPTISYFAQQMYRYAFAASDVFKQQEIVEALISHVGDGMVNECDCALEVMESLVENHRTEMERFTSLIKNTLDYLEYFSVQQIRKVYSVLSMLTYGSEEDTCELHDELASVIRKQLHHSDPKYCHIGIIAAVVVVKCIGHKRETPEFTLLGVMDQNESHPLSPQRKQQALDILKQVVIIINKDVDRACLFFDEMANVLMDGKIHNEILEFIHDKITGQFQDNFVVESTDDLSSSDILLHLSYGLDTISNDDDGSITINLLPLILQSVPGTQESAEHPRVQSLCSHFRLLRVCEHALNGELAEIDALLGCPVIMPDPSLLNKESIQDLPLLQKQCICASLFHCLNWFRELVSAFADEEDPEMKGKVIQRLDAITELQHQLDTCLSVTAGPLPTVQIGEDGKSKPLKKKKSSSKAETTLATIVNDTQTDEVSKDMTIDKTVQVITQSTSLQRVKPYFRELDLSAFLSLSYEPLSRSVLDTNFQTRESEELKLQVSQLLFLLQELYQKTSAQFSFFAAKKRSADKQLSGSSSEDNKLAKMMSDILTSALCEQLETVIAYFREQAAANDGVLDTSIRSQHYQTTQSCLQMIFRILASFFNWPLLADPVYEPLLKGALKAMANRISQELTQEESTCDLLARSAYTYLEGFTEYIPNLMSAVALSKLLVAIYKATKIDNIKRNTAAYCGKLLKRTWCESESTSETNKALEYLIKYHIEWSLDPLQTSEEICGEAVPELMGEDAKDQSILYPTLTFETFSCYYRCMLAAVVNCVKNIPAPSKHNTPTGQVLLECLQSLELSTKVFHILINLVKSFDTKRVITAALKYGRHFIEAFLKSGIPIIDTLFKLRKDDVVSVLKTLQQSTRCLQHYCGHSKIAKDISLISYVPLLKKCMEILLFRVKEVLIDNNCAEAFMLGILKNRDLQGQEILSQVSQTICDESDEDDHQNDTASITSCED